MSGTRLRSPVVLLALVACACSASARGIDTVPAPARQPSVTTDVVYGHKDGLALTPVACALEDDPEFAETRSRENRNTGSKGSWF